MSATLSPALSEPTNFDVDKLSYEIFSILESKFLFGYDDPKIFASAGFSPGTPAKAPAALGGGAAGRVRILSIDGGGRPSDGLLSAASLARLESSLRRCGGDPSATVADSFDVVAGSGAGGVLAALLFTRGQDGRPLFSADEALRFFAKAYRDEGAFAVAAGKKGFLRGLFRPRSRGIFRRVFGDATLRDTMKPVLVPCYDMASGAPFLFSRADAVETDGYDFKLSEVCAATCADAGSGAAAPVEMRSLDGRTRILAVGGGVAMGNPAAAAITHVLHNKQEFPFAAGVEDIMLISLGTACGGEAASGGLGHKSAAAELVRIAGQSAADMVDQAVAMAFGPYRATNYLRIQCNADAFGLGDSTPKIGMKSKNLMGEMEKILLQRNVESLLFQGKKISGQTNGEKMELFAGELIKEEERRKRRPLLPTVVVKQASTPRTSSAATTPTATSSTRSSTSPCHTNLSS